MHGSTFPFCALNGNSALHQSRQPAHYGQPQARPLVLIEQAITPGSRRPVLIVATDGAHMPTRPGPGRNTKRGLGEYKEAKGFRIYLNSKGRIIHVASWHQIGGKEEITHALNVAASRIPTEQVRIGLIGDGASWLWDAMSRGFPSGRQILDSYHVSEYMHKVAESWSMEPLPRIKSVST